MYQFSAPLLSEIPNAFQQITTIQRIMTQSSTLHNIKGSHHWRYWLGSSLDKIFWNIRNEVFKLEVFHSRPP